MPEYDADGRLMAVHVDREPEWTPAQVALVLGVEAHEASVGAHGQPLDEATSSESDPNNPEGIRAYRAGIPVVTPEGSTVYAPLRDWAMKAQLDAMDKWREAAGDNANTNGLFFPVSVIERGDITNN